MKKILYLMLVVILASSCATGYYVPLNVNQFGTQTQVVLSEANFRIVRSLEVVVDVNTSYLKRADVEKSAYAELLRNANLTGSQALINVVIEEVRREDAFRNITQYVAARGTIIEFLPNGEQTAPSVSATTPVENEVIIDFAQEEANKYYMAWLYKTQRLVVSKEARDQMSKYNYQEIVQIASQHSEDELKKLSEGYDKDLKKFRKNK